MEKISISNIIEFRRRTPSSQISFINNLNKPKEKGDEGSGGDYWIHSISTIAKIFISEKKDLLKEKIGILSEKHNASSYNISKDMYSRNISILSSFENFKIARIKPNFKLEYLTRPKDKSIVSIKGLPVQVLPQHVYTFKENEVNKISAVWFVSKLKGYKIDELAIFTDALYRYLKWNYSNKYKISSDFCIAVDVINLNSLSYSQILNKEIPLHLNSTLDSINKVLK